MGCLGRGWQILISLIRNLYLAGILGFEPNAILQHRWLTYRLAQNLYRFRVKSLKGRRLGSKVTDQHLHGAHVLGSFTSRENLDEWLQVNGLIREDQAVDREGGFKENKFWLARLAILGAEVLGKKVQSARPVAKNGLKGEHPSLKLLGAILVAQKADFAKIGAGAVLANDDRDIRAKVSDRRRFCARMSRCDLRKARKRS